MANLASVIWIQGGLEEAEDLEVQVMKTRKRVLGQEHPATLTSMHNLAFTLKSEGRDNEALLIMEECFGLRKQRLGLDHLDAMSSLETLNQWKMENLALGS
jgi:hypothetical protein